MKPEETRQKLLEANRYRKYQKIADRIGGGLVVFVILDTIVLIATWLLPGEARSVLDLIDHGFWIFLAVVFAVATVSVLCQRRYESLNEEIAAK